MVGCTEQVGSDLLVSERTGVSSFVCSPTNVHGVAGDGMVVSSGRVLLFSNSNSVTIQVS